MRAIFYLGRSAVILFFLAAGLPATARAATAGLTLLSRETFQGVGTLNNGSPGGLGTVVGGNFNKRAVGPKISGDTTANGLGWSADASVSGGSHYWTAPGGRVDPSNFNGMICAWYFMGDVISDHGGDRSLDLLAAVTPNGLTQASIRIPSNSPGLLFHGDYAGADPTAIAFPKNQWVFLVLAWTYTNATYDGVTYRAYYMLPGGSLTQLNREFSVNNAGYIDGLFLCGGQRSVTGNTYLSRWRYGCPSYYRIASFADVATPSDLVAPPARRHDWYVNPATGSDFNDGTSPNSAWASVAKINAESASAGLFPGATYDAGDILHLDCSGTPLAIGSAPWEIKTRGLTVLQTGGALDPMATLGPGAWTPAAGHPGVYSTTDNASTDLTAAVVREDGKYLAHPNGSTFDSVSAFLDATPGSFFCDDTTLYVHPFGNTDPRSDGKTYRRTRNRTNLGSDTGLSAVMISAPDVRYDGLVISGTTLCRKTDNDPIIGYCLQWVPGSGGANLLSNFSVDHFSKHAIGCTVSGSGSSYTRQDGVYGQASPYVGYGGSTADVQFSGDATSSGIQWAFVRCRQDVNVGVIGSAAGRADPSGSFYTSHASGVAFSLGQFIDCRTPGYIEEQGCTAGIYLRGSTFSSVNVDCALTAEQCCTTAGPITTGQSWLTLRNCLLKVVAATSDYQFARLGGSLDLAGCTIDLRGNPMGSYAQTAVWGRASGSDARVIRIRNTALLVDADKNFTLLQGFSPSGSDTLDLDYNCCQLGANSYFLDTAPYTPLTFAQWQAASGQDAHSRVLSDLGLSAADARPTGYGAAVIDAGAALGPLTDLDGAVIFPGRRTVGAYEFKPSFSLWQNSRFANPIQRGGPLADPDDNGLSNLLEYAFGLAPGATAAAALAAQPAPAPPAVTSTAGLTMTYRALQNSADLTYAPEVSADLKTWQSGAAYVTQTGAADFGSGVSAVTVRASAPAAGMPPWRFMRLRVTLAGSN